MTLVADLFWSFRSPYSYLATKRYRILELDYDLQINVRPVYPLAIRQPDFFDKVNPQWVSYLLRDCQRIADYHDLPFTFPNPDPVVMNMLTREIAVDQPHIYWLTRLGVAASKTENGMAFIDNVSSMIWGGRENWQMDENLGPAVKRAKLDLHTLRQAIEGNEEAIDAEIADNQEALEKAGHWGVPTLVFENEPFFGQDRIEMALWRMQKKGLEKR